MDPQSRIPNAQVVRYISGRVQERILNIGIAQDARVSAIESACVMVTMAECEHRQEPVVPPTPRAARPNINNEFPVSCWEALDGINLQEVFESRFNVFLQSCPHSVRGKFREARSEAVRVQDAFGEACVVAPTRCRHSESP